MISEPVAALEATTAEGTATSDQEITTAEETVATMQAATAERAVAQQGGVVACPRYEWWQHGSENELIP